MVNTDEFIKRLEILLDYYTISASAFADSIGVQRSGLSHLLSGRNKPSLDFIMKIVENYPEVDLYWLLNGKGSFPKGLSQTIQPAPSLSNAADNQEKAFDDLFSEKNIDDNEPTVQNSAPLQREIFNQNASGSIERIVIFYKDGTFKNYNPQ